MVVHHVIARENYGFAGHVSEFSAWACRDMDCPVRGWLVTALLPPPWRAPPSARGAAPTLAEFAGTSWREGGGGLVADGPLGVRRIRWLLRCSHLLVPVCRALCTVCVAALFAVALLRAFLPIWCCFFFCSTLLVRAAGGGGERVTPCLACGPQPPPLPRTG